MLLVYMRVCLRGESWGYVQRCDQREDPNGLKIFLRIRGHVIGPNKCSGRPDAAWNGSVSS
jgi:hypothetical protein